MEQVDCDIHDHRNQKRLKCPDVEEETDTLAVMFRERRVLADLSTGQRDPDDWEIGRLRTVDYFLDTRVLTYEPTLSLLAVGEIS